MASYIREQVLSGAAPTWNMAKYKQAVLALSANADITIVGAVKPGGALIVVQDTTARTLFIGGQQITINPTPGAATLIETIVCSLGTFPFSSYSGGGLIQLETPVLTAGTPTKTTIPFTWNAIANESSFVAEITLSTDTTFSAIVQTLTPAANATSATFTGLLEITNYRMRIRAIGDGVTYSNSNNSTAVTATTTTDALHFSRFTGTNGTNITAYTPDSGTAWTVVVGSGYEIQSNKAQANFDGTNLSIIRTTLTSTDIQVTFPIYRSNYDVHVYLRATSNNDALLIVFSGGYTEVYNKIGGVPGSYIHQNASQGIPATTNVEMQITITGTTLTVYRDATLIFNGVTIPTDNMGDKLLLGLGAGTFDSVYVKVYP